VCRTGGASEPAGTGGEAGTAAVLTALQFCSTGITALLAARQHAQTAGAEVIPAAVPQALPRVLTLVGLDQIFTLHADADAPDT
jgi:anti-anti-sigma regulatory factor